MLAAYVVGVGASLVLRSMSGASVWQAYAIPFTAFAAVGWLVAVRRPREPIGWLFLGIGVLTGVGVASDAVIGLALHRGWECHGVVMLAAWTQLWFWYPLLLMSTAYTLLLFPRGLPSRRWRPVVWLLTATVLAMSVAAALSPTVEFGKRHLPNPVGLHSHIKNIEDTPLFNVAGLVIAGCVIASIVSLGVRFHRSRGIERAQLKWFLLGASVLGFTLVLSLFSKSFNNSTADNVMAPIALTAMPVSCGLAILRYRLYDIDRIVSRAVTYVLLTGLLVAGYVGCVAVLTSLLPFGSSVGVAASTLAVAGAFQPLRRRVQRVIDRRFDRAAYDARRTVDAFSTRLRVEVDVTSVTADLLDTAATAVAPSSASVWLVAT